LTIEEAEMLQLTEELRALLDERRYATLATHDPEGMIHLTPIWFLFDGEWFYFESFSGSRKVKNLERNASASVVVDAREPGRERWVSASGTTEILTGDEAQAINSKIRRRYLTQDALEDARIEPAFAAGDDVTIRLKPTRWRSWAAKDLDERVFGGILGRMPERWFLTVDV
jgi:PPOX class probable F420-dependent enzyme